MKQVAATRYSSAVHVPERTFTVHPRSLGHGL
jgi:hypothetical protein